MITLQRLRKQVDVDADKVACVLLDAVVESSASITLVYEGAIRAGVDGAAREIDDDVYDDACLYIAEQVAVEVEKQAKQIAMRLMREMAGDPSPKAAAAG